VITSDGTRIISGSRDQTVRVWDAETGSNLLTLCGHSGDVKSVTVSHNETQIISGSDDGTVCFWDMRTGTLLQSFGDSPASINLVAISDDDSRVMAATYDGTIRVWNVQTGALIQKVQALECARLNIPAALRKREPPDVRIQLRAGQEDYVLARLESFPYHSRPDSTDKAYFHDSNGIVYMTGGKSVRIWNKKNGNISRFHLVHRMGCYANFFSHDGTKIISELGLTVGVWDAQTGALLHKLAGHSWSVSSVSMSRTGNCLVSGSWDNTIRV